LSATASAVTDKAVFTRPYKEIDVKRRKRRVTIILPDEFLDLCENDLQTPETVLRGFIGDLCGIVNWHCSPRADGYNSTGSDERGYAQAYYDRLGYRYHREDLKRQI
jgi:hypothetical protein